MMEQMQLTPCKSLQDHETTSPSTHKTPSKQNGWKHNSYHSASLALLQNHITPPSGLTKFIARNPFDADLTNRLHLSVISPTIFSKVSPTTQDSPAFAWTIDELAIMTPAKIDEFPLQQSHSSDPDVEIHAQKAIDRFFSEPQIHPSPWNEKKEPMQPLVMLTPSRPLEALSNSRESQTGSKDCGTQTVLTLPPTLPKDLEEALRPYFTYTQDQTPETDDANSSNNSLRRKLFFNHEETSEDESEASFNLSPLKGSSSPPQSGLFVHGTPLRGRSSHMQRTHGTPYANSGNLSPPNMSPICNPLHEMSCQSIQSRRRSAARLDFTTFMSIDTSGSEEKGGEASAHHFDSGKPEKSDKNDENHEKIQKNDENYGKNAEKRENFDKNETIEMISLLEGSTPIKLTSEKGIDVERVKDAVDWYRSADESANGPKHCNTLIRSNYSEISVFNGQDTGYQTYSMNNTSDNHSITSIKKAFNWNERIHTICEADDVKSVNWEENMKHMYSSTPSKSRIIGDN